MASNNKGKNDKTSEQAALATAEPGSTSGALALTGHDEMAALGDLGLTDDGLGEIDRDDIRISARVFNMKGTDPKTGRKIPEDAYFDTVDETVSDTIDAALLDLHKSNLYSRFSNAEDRTEIICRSYDRVTGTMQDSGEQRPCKGCPDAEWRNEVVDGKQKRARNCGPVYNVFAVDRGTGLPFVVRFKRTSLDPIKSYLQKHFIGRRVLPGGKRTNYPLFAFQTRMSCTMDPSGKYALPVLQRGDLLSADEIKAHAEAQRFLREHMLAALDKTEAQAMAREGVEPNTDFDPAKMGGGAGKPDAFAQGEGQDFVG